MTLKVRRYAQNGCLCIDAKESSDRMGGMWNMTSGNLAGVCGSTPAALGNNAYRGNARGARGAGARPIGSVASVKSPVGAGFWMGTTAELSFG